MDDVTWRKAQRSNDQEGACVELAPLTGGVGVRDSKDPDGPQLRLDPAAFRALLSALTQQVAATGYPAWAAEMDDEDRAYRAARRGWARGS